ncbi:asparagine synthase [Catenulispora acidiphila DSM 44928]|uniref:Asparagine synthase n=2 Tax=Catenulispora TaxID=414878 RepID=C7Q3F4_CATAD|nr:asparagine synthase [Catenulispora acidiphila DSM 44928]
MLSFDISVVADGSRTWSRDGDQWIGPAGWVRPFVHPALESVAVIDGPRLRLSVAERCEEPDFVRLDTDGRTVTVEAGPLGRAPIYLRHRNNRITGSWRISDLMDSLPYGALNDRGLIRLLTRRHRFSADTVFADIVCLTERARISAGPAGIQVRYPDPVERPVHRRALRRDVDPVAVIGDLLGRHLEQRPTDGVELSGGADSALVAAELAGLFEHRVRSFGLVMPGQEGIAQTARREAIAETLKLTDTPIHAVLHPPFGAGRRYELHNPASSYYCESFDALAAAARSYGVRAMATGFGGDELMACPAEAQATPTEEFLPEWLSAKARAAVPDIEADLAPPAHLYTPTLMALASHAPGLLAAGIWQIAPLADPALTRFCRQLPEELVIGKRVLRERLALRIPKRVAYRSSPETFRPIMEIGMRRFGLPLLDDYLKRGLLLAELGMVEPAVLQAATCAAQSGTAVDSRLADVLRLEHGLRLVWGEL